MRLPGKADVLALALVLAATAAYTGGVTWRRAQLGIGAPNHDTYQYFYPNILYSLDSLRSGEGVLWNRFQNCGQPFLAIAANGLLYPPNFVFRFFAPNDALFALFAIHLFLAGAFAYFLFRELGCGAAAALTGTFAFQLGGLTLLLAFWVPLIFGHYVFLPAALLACERTLRAPSPGNAVLLGLVLAVQFLAGYPQTTIFTYQVLALRLLWEIATERGATRPRALLAVGFGMLLPVALVAVQLFPSVEFAAQSLRARALTPREIRPPAFTIDWKGFLQALEWRTQYGAVFVAAPMALAGLGFTAAATRRATAFYVLLAALTLGLAFETPLAEIYRQLPLGRTFRLPQRFLWVTNFAFAALAALGAEAVIGRRTQGWASAATVVVAAALGVLLMHALAPTGLKTGEMALVAAVTILAAAAAVSGMGRWAAALALPVLVLVNLTALGAVQIFGLLPSDAALFSERRVFDFVRGELTLQDRMYQFSLGTNLGMQKKSASLFRLPSITDYETQASQRYAELFVRMIHNRPMESINQYYYQVTQTPRNRPLLDLLATRYLVVAAKGGVFWPPQVRDLRLLRRFGLTRVYANDRALPRAFFVPRAEVVGDPKALLERLVSPSHDPRRVALVEEPPPGGGLGSEEATGHAAIIEDRSEALSLRVEASEPGFLFLSDQDYPGWEATVNGEGAPIARANYAFRLVRVPAGDSTVVFRYRPFSLRLGKWVSAATVVLLALFFTVRWAAARRSRR
jgi:hypothetical protein